MSEYRKCKLCEGQGKIKGYGGMKMSYEFDDDSIYQYELSTCRTCGGSGKTKEAHHD